ncbi:MAG: sensor domain-containing diguanylate cyclase [Lachnospiraceae bacterium]|nr:sensor domain-containing diguanylate cyclase [Lachnospiraceae bacterium]
MSGIKTWDFYEELNEFVYVVDMDTHELVFMNRKAREMRGIQSLDEIKGKKCYEILSNSRKPCILCNNNRLKPGYFLEEVQYHPALKRKLALKQTMVEEDGCRYRFELAIDLSAWDNKDKEYENNAVMVNEGLRISMLARTPEESVAVLLDYLGQALKSERVYIFEETDRGTFNNTYEWCAEGVTPQKENLQDVPFEVVSLWYQHFQNGENVIIDDVEDIQDSAPAVYEYLKPQNIRSLVVSPLVCEERIIGFYGVDNPPKQFLMHITAFFQILGQFMVSLFHRRDHVRKLEELCFQDQLTGIGNRHAMNEYITVMRPEQSVGVLFGDVMGLKRANDTRGHLEGDNLLMRASECLKSEFSDYAMFRVGGDEFLAICEGITEQEFLERAERLSKETRKRNANMAFGFVWRPDGSENIDKLITIADDLMYEDKRAQYERMEGKKELV